MCAGRALFANGPTALLLALLLALSLAVCGESSEPGVAQDPSTAEDFCGANTVVQDGRCVSTISCGDDTVLEDGTCVPGPGLSDLSCGAGTTESGTECIVAAEACGVGTSLTEGTCELATAACGTGTTLDTGECVLDATACGTGTTLDTGECVLDATACGTGTTLGTGECVVDASACGTDATLSAGQCVGVLSCGGGTERVADECVGTLACGRGAVQTTDDAGDPVCIEDIWTEVSVFTTAERLAEEYCASFFRCCDPVAFAGLVQEGAFPAEPFIEQQTCVEAIMLFIDTSLGLPEARLLASQEPPRLTQDVDLMADVEALFTVGDSCNLEFTPELIAAIDTEVGPPAVFQGQRTAGEPCSVTLACIPDLMCPISGTNVGRCALRRGKGETCEEHWECQSSLYCADDSTCQDRLGQGGVCREDTDCADDLSCFKHTSGGANGCYPVAGPVPATHTCDSPADCPTGQYCNTNLATPACGAVLTLGTPCAHEDACGPVAYCFGPVGSQICTRSVDICTFPLFEDDED